MAKLMSDSDFIFYYSESLVDYSAYIITCTSQSTKQSPDIRITKSNGQEDLSDSLSGKLKPKVVYTSALPDTLLYLTCYDPYEITAPHFYRWLYEMCMLQFEQTHLLLSTFMKSRNKLMKEDRDKYNKRHAAYWARITLFKDIMNYASIQFTESD